MSVLERFDAWLAPDGPVAVTMHEPLEPVLGEGAVIFPPTFAPPAKGEPPSYVIDETSQGKTAIVDTVGSQANRMEPMFKKKPYSKLVPHAVVKVGTREVNLLDAGHRAADALVRFSIQKSVLSEAFRAISERGDFAPLARLAPTSLVFGVWDSRDTGVKVPRLVGSTVRAYGVEPLTRSAQYFSAFEKSETETLGQTQEFLSEQGLSDAPAGRGPGGVVARGGIRRESVLNLVALRALAAESPEATKVLQRYVLGLALVALTAPLELFLREGCLLVPSGGEEAAIRKEVSRSGKRLPFAVNAESALEFAKSAAEGFKVGPAWGEAAFDAGLVKAAANVKAAKAKVGKERKEREKKDKEKEKAGS
jgi:CRISPR-associated protein Csb1